MLERATSCVEPASQYFLRCFEPPLRSNRLLGPAFWKNGGDNLAVPPWWPLYLDTVRKVPNRSNIREKTVAAQQHLKSNTQRTEHYRTRDFSQFGRLPQPSSSSIRTFSNLQNENESSSLYDVSPSTVDGYVSPGGIEDAGGQARDGQEIESEYQISKTEQESKIGFSQLKKENYLTNEQSLNKILQSKEHKGSDYNTAWLLLVALPSQGRFAQEMLVFLSASGKPIDLDRAIRCFTFIPQTERGVTDYNHAVRVAIKLRRYSLAVQINSEAMSRDLGQDSGQILLSSCLKQGLWKNAAKAWQMISDFERDQQRMHMTKYRFGETSWSIIDEMVNLPAALSLLSSRLSYEDPILAADSLVLHEMAHNLLTRLFKSVHIMGVITARGILRLLFKHRKLDILTPNQYYEALHTLHEMRKVRNRAETAILIIRNLRFFYSDIVVPKAIYGLLISICADANQPPRIFDYILDQFSLQYGKPDKAAYQRVMTALARQGDVFNVQQLFNRFSEQYGFPDNLGYHSPLLYAYARTGNVKGTQRRFEQIRSHGLVPNTHCWNILIYAHARSETPGRAFGVFNEMKIYQGARPDAHTFGILLGIHSNSGDTQAVNSLIELASKSGVPGTTALVDTLIHAYCLNDDIEEAEKLAEGATKMYLKGSPVRMWNTLLRHFAFQADADGVERVQKKMKQLDVEPDSMTYAALMTALVVLGRTKDAAQILRSLHFKQFLTITPFHYAIVLHGYAQEGNRDMTTVIYDELKDRFPTLSASARLSMLHIQSKRSRSKSLNRLRTPKNSSYSEQYHATEFLADVLFETTFKDLASKEPQPGFGRQPPYRVIPSVYMEFLIGGLAQSNNMGQAKRLLERYESLKQTPYLSLNERSIDSIGLLTVRMMISIRQEQWAVVDLIWDEVLTRGIRAAVPVKLVIDDHVSSSSNIQSSEADVSSMNDTISESRTAKYAKARALGSLVTHPDFGMESPLDNLDLKILPAQKFVLSTALTRYIQALDLQAKQDKIRNLVEKMEEVGFALSNKNWNSYIQALCKSADVRHKILAFKIFQEKLLPNTPPWKLLVRGKWINPSATWDDWSESVKPQPVDRRKLEKRNPGQLMPTYFTVVYLANALLNIRGLADKYYVLPLQTLEHDCPETLRYITQIPYNRDKIQSILLRSRKARRDLMNRPSQITSPDRSGLLGSRSTIDQVPVHELSNLKASSSLLHDTTADVIAGDDPIEASANRDARIKLAERYTGEIIRSPMILAAKQREETEYEMLLRIKAEEAKKVKFLERLRQDSKSSQMMSNDYVGDHVVNVGQRGSRFQSLMMEDESSAAVRPVSEIDADFSTYESFRIKSSKIRLLRKGKGLRKPKFPKMKIDFDRRKQDMPYDTSILADRTYKRKHWSPHDLSKNDHKSNNQAAADRTGNRRDHPQEVLWRSHSK